MPRPPGASRPPRPQLIEEIIAEAAGTSTQRELDRVRTQAKAGLLMSLEAAGARPTMSPASSPCYGRLVEPAEVVAELEAVTLDRSARPAREMLAGPRARATIGVPGGPRGVTRSHTLVAEPWADWGLVDCGHGRKLERYGPVRVVRPEPQAMWAPASADWDPDATFVPGSDEEGGGRWVQHRPVPREAGSWRAAAVTLPRLADAVPPPRLLPRHGAAMGLDARARPRTPRCSTCSATPASAACC